MNLKLLLVFFLFTLTIYRAQNLDYRILKQVNQTEKPFLDKSMRFISNSVFIVSPVSVATIWTDGYINKNEVMMRNAYKSVISIGFSSLLTSGLKYLVNRPRPFVTYPNDIIQRGKAGKFSFPSGHTGLAFATATALTLSTQNVYVAIPSYLYATLVAYSRMRLGLHYTSDVLGGMVIGIGSGLLTWQLDRMINKQ